MMNVTDFNRQISTVTTTHACDERSAVAPPLDTDGVHRCGQASRVPKAANEHTKPEGAKKFALGHNPSALEWLESLIEKNKLGKIELVKPMHWKRATSCECHANANDFCQGTNRWQPVFGYALDIVGDAQFQMHNHSVVRDKLSGELRHLTNCKKEAKRGTPSAFVADSVITACMRTQLADADERLQALLTARFSEPMCITGVAPMPFGRDEASEQDTLRVVCGASLKKDNSLRQWVIASCVLDDGTTANVCFHTYYDNMIQGLQVGIPRLVAAAALAKRAREFGVSDA